MNSMFVTTLHLNVIPSEADEANLRHVIIHLRHSNGQWLQTEMMVISSWHF